MPILGAHMSIAGGLYKAVEAAAEVGCDCVQLFTKNNNQWNAKDLTDDDVRAFREALDRLGITHPISHDSYLINLAAPDDALWKKSIDAYIVELQRAEQIGLAYVVMHPGAFTSSSEAEGLRRVIQAFDEVHRQTPGLRVRSLVETTAGQGTCLGHRFEHLAEILGGVSDPKRMGICFDTCHVFAAGYPLADPADYAETMRQLNATVGLEQVRAFHLNDSKKPLGSRVDRHEHIGQGALGLGPFRNLLNDKRFSEVPMYLETPKEEKNGEKMDVVNLRTLRGLVGGKPKRATARQKSN